MGLPLATLVLNRIATKTALSWKARCFNLNAQQVHRNKYIYPILDSDGCPESSSLRLRGAGTYRA